MIRGAAFHSPRDVVGNPAEAIQQDVSIAQQNAVMMVIRVTDLPKHFAVPVSFQDDAALEGKPTEKTALRGASVIEQGPARGQITGQAGRIGHIPGVDDLAPEVDEIHGSVLLEMWGKEGEPWTDPL